MVQPLFLYGDIHQELGINLYLYKVIKLIIKLKLKFLLYYRVSTHVLALLAIKKVQPAGLFLESPFNNIADELSEHPLAQVLLRIIINQKNMVPLHLFKINLINKKIFKI